MDKPGCQSYKGQTFVCEGPTGRSAVSDDTRSILKL